MDSSVTSSGFSNHVMNQLQGISHQQTQRGRGRGTSRGRGRGSPRRDPPPQRQPINEPQALPWSNPSEDFPPLGTIPPATHGHPNVILQGVTQPSVQSHSLLSGPHESPREFQERARGAYRGHHHPPRFASPYYQPVTQTTVSGSSNNYERRPPRNGHLFNPGVDMHYGTAQQLRNMRHIVIKQSEYLLSVGKDAYKIHKLQKEESIAMETFRQELEKVAKEALAAGYPDLDIRHVKLKCYGSLANGFALAGCDMDLLLSLPNYQIPENITADPLPSGHANKDLEADDDVEQNGFKVQVRRVLEKALLDRGYGARLLTNTRVPILRVCQSPDAELLNNLRHNRAEWEKSLHGTDTKEENASLISDPSGAANNGSARDVDQIGNSLTELNLADGTSTMVTGRSNARLEFTGDVGIHCDINFTNFVAIHNSLLLRLYHNFDTRVADLGVFVKIWAKARDINTPYRGTLSSYGYILMVLHYLMHVASPPVIPNLQVLAKFDDGWNPEKPVELFEGFDIRFISDPKEIEDIRSMMPRNHESTGQLLRGFFQYYATRDGFHWTRDVISIREKTGRLSKAQKGWTEAKWAQKSKQQVRLRYLLAIEDPFEVEHNIGRTVGHHGLVAIRDEFRRAWSIIERIGIGEEVSTDEFIEQVENRGDTLRRDQEFHRQRQLQMKQELEAREKELMQKVNQEDRDANIDGTSGNANHGQSQTAPSLTSTGQESGPKLTRDTYQARDKKNERQGWRKRKVKEESDSEDDDSVVTQNTQSESKKSDIDPRLNGTNSRIGVFCPPGAVLGTDGFDAFGNIIPWDIDTQDGRWLQWRDNKIRKGGVLNFATPQLRELHEQCPYDPMRPNPYANRPYEHRGGRKRTEPQKNRPPWPASICVHEVDLLDKTAADQPSNETESIHSIPDNHMPPGSTTCGQIKDRTVCPDVENDLSSEVAPNSSEFNDGQFLNAEIKPHAVPSNADSDGLVGVVIPWENRSPGGRWLRWRDKRMREGKWRSGKVPRHKKEINERFPYDPNMTWRELKEKNEELLTSYFSSIFRTKLTQSTTSGMGDLGMARANVDVPGTEAHLELPEFHDRRALMNKQCTTPGVLGPAISHKPAIETSASENITLPQITPPSTDRTESTTNEAFLSSPNSEFVRMQRLAFFGRRPSTAMSEHESNTQFFSRGPSGDSTDNANENIRAVGLKGITSKPPAELPDLPQSSEKSSADGHGTLSHETSILDDSFFTASASVKTNAGSAPQSPVLVPTTLFPNMENDKRSRDEDPNIMPIPRELGFQFDPRQLQDLNVIAKGGNGCARDGAEFCIEEDYELGGGGMMGYKSSTGAQQIESTTHTPYEAGRGDEEGLLLELPGELD